MPRLISVVTTIQTPTECMRRLGEKLTSIDCPLVVMGDKKGPQSFDQRGAELFALEQQIKLPFGLARLLPTGHYVRKNLGYLIAISRGAECIYETDDDNAPLPDWAARLPRVRAQPVEARPWMNVYRLFSDDLIWPRGFPLELIRDPGTYNHDRSAPLAEFDCPIQQGLANNAPDVDAVWRLVLDRPFDFRAGPSVWLPPETYCPFNSQTTWWWPPAFPLMYLPSFCSFRMTDIWRSFVAQRCLWEIDRGLVFHGPEAYQERNVHSLIRDFKDEVPGYLENARIARVLGESGLRAGPEYVGENLAACYTNLAKAGVIPGKEMELVFAWLHDLKQLAAAGV